MRSRQVVSRQSILYSYTSDIPWLNHEWLSEVVLAVAYRAGGVAGLVAIKILFATATYALLAPVLRRAPEEWRWPTAFLAVLGINPIALTVRPQLWTMFFVVLLCRTLDAMPSRRWFLPLVFAVWANVHGGWIVGVGVLFVWSFVELVTRPNSRPSLWILIGVPVACGLATLANPYGVRLWIFIADTVRLSRANIIEWQPVWVDSIGAAVLWLLAIGWTALVISRARYMAAAGAGRRRGLRIRVVARQSAAAVVHSDVDRFAAAVRQAAARVGARVAQGAAPDRCRVHLHRGSPAGVARVGGMHSNGRQLAS